MLYTNSIQLSLEHIYIYIYIYIYVKSGKFFHGFTFSMGHAGASRKSPSDAPWETLLVRLNRHLLPVKTDKQKWPVRAIFCETLSESCSIYEAVQPLNELKSNNVMRYFWNNFRVSPLKFD